MKVQNQVQEIANKNIDMEAIIFAMVVMDKRSYMQSIVYILVTKLLLYQKHHNDYV